MPPKIKLLHLIKSLGRGGAEMLLPETLKLHNQELFEFHYIYFLPWKNQMVEFIQVAGGSVHCFDARNNVAIIAKLFSLRKYISKNKIDLVHCHLPWAGFVGRLLFKLTGIPVIYTEHNKQERYHTLTRLFNKVSFNWQAVVVAVSEDVRQSIVKNVAPRIPVITILNGVNTESFKRNHREGEKLRAQFGIPLNAIVVGTIAVFRFQKRLLEWMEVAAKVHLHNPEVYFMIVGDGPLKDEIVKRSVELKLNERWIMPGLQKNVVPWLSAMDIYLMSSLFEGLPIALLEAMSMECAVVTTDAGGIKEVIRNKTDGLMIGVDQWKDLVPVTVELATDEGGRRALGKAARARVEESFSLKRMVEALEYLYVDIIK